MKTNRDPLSRGQVRGVDKTPFMESKQALIELISQTEIFVGLKAEYHKALAGAMTCRTFRAGAKIVTQGEEGEEFFLLVSGSVNVLVEDYALWTEQVILELGVGQSFGEAALLTNESRSATVQAKEPTECAVLSRAGFGKLLKRFPEVAIAVSRYLARRLAVQCKLTGFRFVSSDELIYEPRTYKAFSESVLRRWQAIPLGVKGRTVTVALTKPNDVQAIRALQKEVPGLGLETVACSEEDYQAFVHRYRSRRTELAKELDASQKIRIKLPDGSSLHNQLTRLLAAMIGQNEVDIIVDSDSSGSQVLVRKAGFLEPLLPMITGDECRGLRAQIDELLPGEEEPATFQDLAVEVEGRPCQISVSVLRGRDRSRYSISLTDVKSAVPPLRSLFPTEASLNLVRGSLNEQGRIIFLTGAGSSGVSTTLYSLLESRCESWDPKNVLLFEERTLVPQEHIAQFPLGSELTPLLSVAASQKPELIALDALTPKQTQELLFHPNGEPAILAVYRGDDLLDVLADTAKLDGGRAPSLHRVSLILRQKLVRRVCADCCERFEPTEADLKRLRESNLDNSDSHYFKGAGCQECGQTGVRGQVPLFEAIRCSRTLLESLAGQHSGWKEREQALRDSFAFSFRSFARLLIHKGLIDPLEGLRMFPAK